MYVQQIILHFIKHMSNSKKLVLTLTFISFQFFNLSALSYQSHKLTDERVVSVKDLIKQDKKTIESLIKEIIDEKDNKIFTAIKDLKKYDKNISITLLSKYLKSNHRNTKIKTIYILGLIGKNSDQVIRLLAEELKNSNHLIRYTATISLGKVESIKAVDPLILALQDQNENVRVAASKGLLDLGIKAQKAIPYLSSSILDGNWYVRNYSKKSLILLKNQSIDFPDLFYSLKKEKIDGGIVLSMIANLYPENIDNPNFLLKITKSMLNNENKFVRINAIELINEIIVVHPNLKLQEFGINELFEIANDSNPDVQVETFKSIFRLTKLKNINNSTKFKEDLLKILNKSINNNVSVMNEVADAMLAESYWMSLFWDAKDRYKITKTFLDKLKSNDINTRIAALRILETISYKNKNLSTYNINFLLGLLDGNKNTSLKQSILKILYGVLDLDHIPDIYKSKIQSKLLEHAFHESENIRIFSSTNLSTSFKLLPSIALKHYQNENNDNTLRRIAISYISVEDRLNNLYGYEILEDALKDIDIGVKLIASLYLWRDKRLDNSKVIELVRDGVSTKNLQINLKAIEIFAELRERDPYVYSYLLKFLDSENKILKYFTANALSEIYPSKKVVTVLNEILLNETAHYLIKFTGESLDKIKTKESFRNLIFHYRNLNKILSFSYVNSETDKPFNYKYLISGFEDFIDVLLEELDNENLRHSLMHELIFYSFQDFGNESLNIQRSEIIYHTVVPYFISFLNNKKESFIDKKILIDYDNDKTRSVIYGLGEIFNSENKYFKMDSKTKDLVIKKLREIVNDNSNDRDIQWMAATSLQKIGVKVESFFSKNKMIQPLLYKCPFQFPIISNRIGKVEFGLEFDRYNYSCIYKHVCYCGDSWDRLYILLRRRLSKIFSLKRRK